MQNSLQWNLPPEKNNLSTQMLISYNLWHKILTSEERTITGLNVSFTGVSTVKLSSDFQ